MKELTLTKISIICLFIQATVARANLNESLDFIGNHISIISFIIILVANWRKVKAQIKNWIK